MNELRDLMDILDGYYIGFDVTKAIRTCEVWDLKIQGYHKEIDKDNMQESISVLDLVEKIENKHNKENWKILKIEALENNFFNLTVKKLGE